MEETANDLATYECLTEPITVPAPGTDALEIMVGDEVLAWGRFGRRSQ
jgi:hypothetical protein